MPVTLKLSCGGCDATADGTGFLQRRFHGLNGRDYGFGRYSIDDPQELAPEGWVMFDPYTQATYCPTCWAEIDGGGACSRCHGEGTIPVNTSRNLDPQQEHDERCPGCHGTGLTPEAQEEKARAQAERDLDAWRRAASLAANDVARLREALSLARSMIVSGEPMSELAESVIDSALASGDQGLYENIERKIGDAPVTFDPDRSPAAPSEGGEQ